MTNKPGEYTDEEIEVLEIVSELDLVWNDRTVIFNNRLLQGRPCRTASALRRRWTREEQKRNKINSQRDGARSSSCRKNVRRNGRRKKNNLPLNESLPVDGKGHSQTEVKAADPNAWPMTTSWESQGPSYANGEIQNYQEFGLGITGNPALYSGLEWVDLSVNVDPAQYLQGGWVETYGWNAQDEMDALYNFSFMYSFQQ